MEWVKNVRSIIGVGRNYAAHAKELANPVPSQLVLFSKPVTSLLPHGAGPVVQPEGAELHHEVELGVIIGRGGRNIARADAMAHVAGYALCLDMTARNWQNDAKRDGLPWLRAKGLDTFCPVGPFIARDALPLPATLTLSVDGQLRQRGSTADMLWPVDALLADISALLTLQAGDLILTGTPAGVGPVRPGQTMRAAIVGAGPELSWRVVAAAKL